MSLKTALATLSMATLLLIGCDDAQDGSTDPETDPSRNDTQLPVTDTQEYISPYAELPRPESPEQPAYVDESQDSQSATTPAEQSNGQSAVSRDQAAATTDQPTATDPPPAPPQPQATSDRSTTIPSPAVEEVPADTAPTTD